MTFEHDVCPICGQQFAASDDIVVCPDCGTPHHRSCWMQHGSCAHAQEHAQGFVWQSCAPQGTSDSADHAYAATRCPRCGEECAPDALVCPECGKRLGVAAEGKFDYNDDFFLRGVEADPAADLDGFTVREAAMYVQYRVGDYVRKFGRIKEGKKVGWNWAAFFFSPFWFFYRKIYKVGIVFIGVTLAFTLFTAIPKVSEPLEKSYQQIISAIEEYDITFDENKPLFLQLPSIVISDAFQNLEASSQQKITQAIQRYLIIYLALYGVTFLPNFAAALVADSIYKKKITQDVRSMREFAKNAQTFRMLALRRGGVSVLGLIASYMLVSLIMNAIIFYQ